jgi:Alpha-acetolactate decarboxylase
MLSSWTWRCKCPFPITGKTSLTFLELRVKIILRCPGLTLQRSRGANGNRQGQLRPCGIQGTLPVPGSPIHTLFQVSTSAALVEGLYQGAFRGSRLLRHGNFGLGTFIDLDGKMATFSLLLKGSH